MSALQQADRSKAGFTLIEVIAVLVILAVLAAVAIPRYISLIDDARARALEGAVAAGLSHVSLAYGRLCLQDGSEPSAEEVATESGANPPRSADYSFAFGEITGGVNVTATEIVAEGKEALSLTKPWYMP